MSRKSDLENKREHDIAMARCEELHAIYAMGEMERREAELIKENERLEYNNAEVMNIFATDVANGDDYISIGGRTMTRSMVEADPDFYQRYLSGEFAE